MTSSAEDLHQLASNDYRMETVPAEMLVAVIVDCAVALAFRVGRPPSDVIEDIWKTVIPDERWRQLIEARRANDAGGSGSDS